MSSEQGPPSSSSQPPSSAPARARSRQGPDATPTGTRIGLEVHVPLDTRAKLFCPCPADPPDKANTALCPTCTGQPGARPQGVNRKAVLLALKTARVLHARTQLASVVQRKHYVYADLPNNYQRTTTPIGDQGRFWDVGIREVHMEEDPGAYDPETRRVTLDRSGTPLVEIVTEPELRSADQVDEWIGVLRLSLERAGILRPGAELKADVNVSTAGGDRVEVKNVVGGRNAAKAVSFEITRQTREREAGREIPMETRHFDEAKGTTRPSREKETVGDYRYMADPDLRPIDLEALEGSVAAHEDIPGRIAEFQDLVGLELGEAMALLEDEALEALFDALQAEVEQELAIDIALRRLRGELEYRELTLSQADIDPEVLVELAKAWDEDAITKHVFTRLLRRALDGEEIRDELESEGSTDIDLDAVIRSVLEENPEAVADYEAGQEGALNYLVGQVMARTKGRADAKDAREGLIERLGAGEASPG